MAASDETPAPPGVRAALAMVLASGAPMAVAWGADEPALVGNDAWRSKLRVLRAAERRVAAREAFGDAWDVVGPVLQRALRGTSGSIEAQPVRLGGEERWFTAWFSPIPDEDGGVAGALLVCAEVTERPGDGGADLERLRQAVDRERARLHAQFMQAPIPVAVVVGPSLVFELANPLYERMVGRSNLIGRPFREVFPELAPNAPLLRMLEGVYRTGRPFAANEYRVPLDLRGGAAPYDLYFNLTCQPMLDDRGEVFAVLTVAVDVTPQVLARREIAQSRTLLETVLEQLPSGVVIADPDGRITMANERIRNLLGRRLNEDPGGTLARALRGEAVLDEEIALADPDGSRTLLASAAPVRDREGRVVAAVSVVTDISERSRAEEYERHARTEAEIANRTKDEFLAMLGHELRNPLAPIVTALQLMRLRDEGALERERRLIESQVQHLIRLVDDLLDVSRITRGKVELRRQRLELAEVVAKALEMAGPLIEQRQHRLEVAVPATGLLVDGDPVRLAQVTANLLNNAAKYTEPRGELRVVGALEGHQVVLRVVDNGIGLAPEVLPRVFDLFVQGRQALDRAQGGLGLGLAIVRALVEQHGGSVDVHSDGVGSGSAFVVRLPAAYGEDTPVPLPRLRCDPRVARRVLIVDDNVDAAELLAECLRATGHTVVTAYDGPSALGVAAAFEPEVAVLDIGLPVMDGYELARHLRLLPGLAELRLVALTGYGQERDRQAGDGAGFTSWLVKPVVLEELEALL